MENHYVYPLEGIIDSEPLRKVLKQLRAAVEKGLPVSVDNGLAALARADFAEKLKEGELMLHRTAQGIFFPFMQEGYEIGWVVRSRCNDMCYGSPREKFVPLDNFLAYTETLQNMTDDERTERHLPRCSVCGKEVYPIKSFFIYIPKNSNSLRWAEVRVKEPSAKITDKIFGLRPKRKDTIQNRIGEVVQDLFGMRAVLSDYDCTRAVMKSAREFLGEMQVKNYFLRPKDNGYNAVHLIGRMNSSICELQLRTVDSNANAESDASPASHSLREKEILERRLSTPRWQEVRSEVSKIVNPRRGFSLPSE